MKINQQRLEQVRYLFDLKDLTHDELDEITAYLKDETGILVLRSTFANIGMPRTQGWKLG